ncbi:MAG: penicillin-binding protein [Bryobacteraceae bacterium]
MQAPSAKRVTLLAWLILAWAAVIVLRLIKLQVVDHSYYSELAKDQQEKLLDIQAPRGAILDRTGQALAISTPVDSVCVNPMRVPDLSVAADIFSSILDLNPRDLAGKMKLAQDNHRGFMWVKRKVTAEEADRLRNLKLDWIEFRTESKRVYALDSIAAHVLGGVDFEEKGNAGIEQGLDEDLQGHDGAIRLVVDVRQRGRSSKLDSEATPGKTIRLTLHNRLQYIAENELKKSVIAHKCKSGSLVAMNPKTGEILAMANYPTYDPNIRPMPGGDVSGRSNLAVTTPFEPGSVFKVITITAALETTRFRPETIIPCGNGHITLFGRTIHDHNSYSSLPMEDVLARSSNIGAINVGLKVGEKNLYDYVRRFGFGKRGGLPLPGESAGILRPLKRWERGSIASVAMGHEVSVTALQLARACSVIANGGYLVKPKLLLDTPAEPPVRIIRPETAITMRHMMRGVVDKPWGTGFKYAHIPGYSSAGKTGTAQIFDQKAHVYTHMYNASFMGFAPVNDPAVVVVVTVNGASGLAGYGGPAAAPVFREVAAAALRLLNVPKDLPDSPLPDPAESKADDNDLALTDLASSVPQPLVEESEPAPDGQRPFLIGPTVPNFQGMTVRDVVQKSAASGMPVEFVGARTGLVRGQTPAPGNVLPNGAIIRLELE